MSDEHGVRTAAPTHEQHVQVSPEIFSIGGLAVAGFFGGPLALFYLADRDLRALQEPALRRRLAHWFIPLSAVWLYFLFSFPPDLLSQWISYLPQTILWWMVVRHLFRQAHAGFAQRGIVMLPKYDAFEFGFCVFLGLKLVLWGGSVLVERLFY